MADDKDGRENQADQERQRQRERAIEAELSRRDEPEPPVDTSELAFFETALEAVTFPATGTEIVQSVGDREITAETGTYTVAELIPDAETETFASVTAVRARIQRPTVAAAMKRVAEAVATVPGATLGGSQRAAYEKTFLALERIDADDDDEGIDAVRAWIVDRITEKGKLPGSRDVRRQAATFCRSNGYQVRDDEWLGV